MPLPDRLPSFGLVAVGFRFVFAAIAEPSRGSARLGLPLMRAATDESLVWCWVSVLVPASLSACVAFFVCRHHRVACLVLISGVRRPLCLLALPPFACRRHRVACLALSFCLGSRHLACLLCLLFAAAAIEPSAVCCVASAHRSLSCLPSPTATGSLAGFGRVASVGPPVPRLLALPPRCPPPQPTLCPVSLSPRATGRVSASAASFLAAADPGVGFALSSGPLVFAGLPPRPSPPRPAPPCSTPPPPPNRCPARPLPTVTSFSRGGRCAPAPRNETSPQPSSTPTASPPRSPVHEWTFRSGWVFVGAEIVGGRA